jgi:hypothetical protein
MLYTLNDSSQGVVAKSHTRDTNLVNDMLAQTLKTLTILLKLTTQEELVNGHLLDKEGRIKTETYQDTRGVKLYYASKLRLVKEARQCICEPETYTMPGQETSVMSRYNISIMIAFYAMANPKTEFNLTTNSVALDCLTAMVELWRT